MIPRNGHHGYTHLRGFADGSGNLTVKHRSPDKGEEIEYIAVVCENRTSANSEFRIGVSTPTQFYLRQAYLSVAADTPQTYDTQSIYVHDDEQLEVRITGATSGDTIVVVLHYIVKLAETGR